MITSLFFWKDWPLSYRRIGLLAAVLFSLSLVFLWTGYFTGNNGVIHWEKIQEQKVLESNVHSFRLGPFELDVPGESYVIFEYFQGSRIQPNTFASYLFLVLFIASVVILMTVISTLEKFYYLVAMGLFILLMVSLRLEVLGIFGLYNKLPVIVVLSVYVVPSFYFSRFATEKSFAFRLAVFTIITGLLAVVVGYTSEVSYPFYHLTLTAYTSALILSILFVILIAHEIMASFVYVVSQGTSKSLRHLSLISAIYLVNIIITALHEMGVVQWNFIYVNIYLLLSVSAVLGIWGFRSREEIYGNIISFYPFGFYFFLALATICLSFVGQLLVNANDPALKVIRDITIFSHAGYGIIFLTYLFSNYILMLARNLPVYKVLYNPTRMPYFTYRLGGLIATLAFVFVSNWHEYVYHSFSGFYNTAGDMYTLIGNDAYAESFYDQGASQGFANHRSNYALGNIRSMRLNFEGAHEDYDYANTKYPSEFSLTNDGNLYLWENSPFKAIEAYRKGLAVIPSSKVLANNLGVAYSKVHNLDSAISFLNTARQDQTTKSSAEANFFALSAQELLPFQADSILGVFKTESLPTIANALAIATLFHQPFKTDVDPLKHKSLDLYSATFLNNYIIMNAANLDTTFTTSAYRIADDSVNSDFSEAIKASLAHAFYLQQNVSKALSIMAELAFISQSHQGKFNYLMGLWSLEQRNPRIASSYFTYADTYNYKQARLYHAIALTEAGMIPEAIVAWDTVANGNNTDETEIAQRIKGILTLPASAAFDLEDPQKIQFCRYRLGLRDSVLFHRLVDSFKSSDYKVQALLTMSEKYFEADMLIPAIKVFQRIGGLEISDKHLYSNVQWAELRMLAYRREVRTLATQINKGGIGFDNHHFLQKMHYTALIAESNGDDSTAAACYNVVARYNPYYEEGVIAAADYYKRKAPKSLRAYNILAEALQVNNHSIMLLKAYIAEAVRKEFNEYAASASQRLQELMDHIR
jgi:Flp pilus assembly protein TadD